jgi:hypothetical protein
VSSLAGSRRRYVGRGGFRRPQLSGLVALPPISGPWLTGLLTVAILLVVFVARGSSQLERTTWTEVGLILVSAALCAYALLSPRAEGAPTRLRGGVALAALGALGALTALSITWSLMPDASWLETNRTLSYLATFAAGLALGRLVPGRWTSLLNAVALSATVICGWALLSKVFPAWLAPDETLGRLRIPFDYWNSVGLAAGLGLPPMLWLAARRSGHAAVNALAWPGTGILVATLMLSFSRGALVAVVLGLGLWIVLVPLRMRVLVVLAGTLVATVPLIAWAFAQEGLAKDLMPMAVKADAGQAFGALLLLLLITLLIAGLAVGFLSAHRPPSARSQRRAQRTVIGALLVVPAIAVLMLANAPGGIDGQVSKAWKQATDPAVSGPANDPSRLTATSSGRARYYREAIKINELNPALGTGAGAYGTVRNRFRVDTRKVGHAHSYVMQTLADLGWVGLAISLVAAFAWLWAAMRVLGLRLRDRGLHWDAERVGVAALACVALVFGIHSAIDWTWFINGNAVPALLCAGWVASRPTLRERLGAPVPLETAPRPTPMLIGAAVLVLLTAATVSWAALQPVRSLHAQNAALDRLEAGGLPQAASIAEIAHKRDPLNIQPLFTLAQVEALRHAPEEAQRALEQAINLEPANPETWRRLALFRLRTLNDPAGALRAYQAAYFLDPHAARSVIDVVETSRIVKGG